MTEVAEIDLNLLVALGAILEDRNLTRAGARIGLSQPAMSMALARLRRHFGDDRLEREGRGYRLTVFGEQILPVVQDALRQMEATMQRSPRFEPARSDREFSVAASDYTVSILADLLLRQVSEAAPRIRLQLHPIPADVHSSGHGISRHDVVIGPADYGFPGRHRELFRDRFVCVIDRANPRLKDGRLELADLDELPHAVPTFGPGRVTPVDPVLDVLGVRRRAAVTVFGWLTVPFVVAGTGMVAIVPERLAKLAARNASLAIVEAPFGPAELVETAYWHPSHSEDPAVRWLLDTLAEAASKL